MPAATAASTMSCVAEAMMMSYLEWSFGCVAVDAACKWKAKRARQLQGAAVIPNRRHAQNVHRIPGARCLSYMQTWPPPPRLGTRCRLLLVLVLPLRRPSALAHVVAPALLSSRAGQVQHERVPSCQTVGPCWRSRGWLFVHAMTASVSPPSPGPKAPRTTSGGSDEAGRPTSPTVSGRLTKWYTHSDGPLATRS